MMRTLALVILFGSVLMAQPARKQPQYCDGYPNYPIQGCLDAPAVWDMLFRSRESVIAGWVVSLDTEQQPSTIRVAQILTDSVGYEYPAWLSPNEYAVQWRLPRPDVRAYLRARTDGWGYQVVIRPGVLEEGDHAILVEFTDPTRGTAYHLQQRTVLVLP